MSQALFGGQQVILTAGQTRYGCVFDTGDDGGTGESNEQFPVAVAGTIDNLYASMEPAPGTGETVDFTMRKNGGDTSLTCQISGTGKSANDTSNSFTVARDDYISFKTVSSNNGSFAGGRPRIGWRFTPTTSDEVLLSGGVDGSGSGFGADSKYYTLSGMRVGDTTEINRQIVFPCAGTLDNMTVLNSTGPGSGDTRTFTVRKNGSGTNLAVTLSDFETTGEDTVDSVTIAAGDLLSIQHTYTGTPTSSVDGGWSFRFVPDTAGDFPIMATHTNAAATGSTEYNHCSSMGNNWETPEANVTVPTPMDFNTKNVYANFQTAPGAGKSWTHSFRDDVANSGLAVTISDTATSNNATHATKIDTGSLIGWTSEPSGTPTASGAHTLSITANGLFGPANVKTFNDVAKASVKTVNDVAIASVKTWNDIA